MEYKSINCTDISLEEIQEIISKYQNVGWEYTGISSGFPGNMSWIHLVWSKDEPPIEPYKEPSN